MSGSAVRFAVAGDWHGNLSTARQAIWTLRREGIDLLFHVGDLAVRWPGPKKGRFDKRVEQLLADAGIEFLFIDGNHDNHAELRELTLRPDGTRRLSENMAYLPRGTVVERAGLRIGALGGAFSIDRRWRTEGKSVWAELEEPTEDEAQRLIENGPIDVLLLHDVPMGFRGLESALRLPGDVIARADRTRALLQSVVERLKPRLVFCGHWHQRRADVFEWPDGTTTEVHVLADDNAWGGNLAALTADGTGGLAVAPLVIGR
ncbi:metallophosphoesterase family protein [Sinomonas soli]